MEQSLLSFDLPFDAMTFCIAIIRNGRVPPVDNPAGPPPPPYIPSWKQVLSDEDINRIADYLWSKQQVKKDSW
jgi:hypothetical protein